MSLARAVANPPFKVSPQGGPAPDTAGSETASPLLTVPIDADVIGEAAVDRCARVWARRGPGALAGVAAARLRGRAALARYLDRRMELTLELTASPDPRESEVVARLAARHPVVRDFLGAGAGIRLVPRARQREKGSGATPSVLRIWARALRLHQWAKNAVVFAPLFLSGRAAEPAAWAVAVTGFLIMGLVASSTYLVNDMADIEDDRRHWSKRHRPLASGALGVPQAMAAVPVLLLSGLTLAWLLGGLAAGGAAAIYCIISLAYSFGLKRAPLLDAGVLASLFTLRLVFGAMLIGAVPSAWLLVFSMFLFSSLALAKRTVELGRAVRDGHAVSAARGYQAADLPLVAALGASTAVATVLVMVLYLIEDAFPQALYATPQLLWSAPILISAWLGRIWLLCGRGELDDDPVAFAIRDPASILLGLGVVAGFLAATLPFGRIFG